MRIGSYIAVALLCCVPGLTTVAHAQSESPGQTESRGQAVLATAHLDSVVELPLFFRLYRARLPAAQHASYQGSNAMLYDLAGASTIQLDGAAPEPLAEGAGAFI